MFKLIRFFITFIITITFFTAKAQQDQQVFKVGILIYPGVELLDFAGPTDVFEKASGITRGKYEIKVASLDGLPVSTQGNGPKISPDCSLSALGDVDLFIIPGADLKTIDSLVISTLFMKELKSQFKESKTVMSVCTGAYILASTGKLDHLKSTTHFFVADDYADRFSKTQLVKDVRFVDLDSIITTSGVSSGIDGALHIVKKHSGNMIGDMVARGIQYQPKEKEVWPTAAMQFKSTRMQKKEGKICLVCGMDADPKISTNYKNKTYHFCSKNCEKMFLSNPEKYLK